jgi:hypothetical protein
MGWWEKWCVLVEEVILLVGKVVWDGGRSGMGWWEKNIGF